MAVTYVVNTTYVVNVMYVVNVTYVVSSTHPHSRPPLLQEGLSSQPPEQCQWRPHPPTKPPQVSSREQQQAAGARRDGAGIVHQALGCLLWQPPWPAGWWRPPLPGEGPAAPGYALWQDKTSVQVLKLRMHA